ncbi:hypothetical protein [Siminovitchia fordii]|nr:hypothetical protein [Siminovitchia fordii]
MHFYNHERLRKDLTALAP